MRLRCVKPEFWKSRAIAELSRDERLCFIGLWNYCDDSGRGADESRLVKAELFPLDDDVTPRLVEKWLVGLAEKGRILRYSVDGNRFLTVVNFGEHQKINHPTRSRIPAPLSGCDTVTLESSGNPPGDTASDSGKTPSLTKGSRDLGIKGSRDQGNAADAAIEREFETAWSSYPRRPGNPRKSALVGYTARRREGIAADVLLRAVQGYAAHCQREGTQPRYVMLGSTFFGPNERWATDYGPVESPKVWPYVNDAGEPDPDGLIPNPEFLKLMGKSA